MHSTLSSLYSIVYPGGNFEFSEITMVRGQEFETDENRKDRRNLLFIHKLCDSSILT